MAGFRPDVTHTFYCVPCSHMVCCSAWWAFWCWTHEVGAWTIDFLPATFYIYRVDTHQSFRPMSSSAEEPAEALS